jgi:ribosomal protein L35
MAKKVKKMKLKTKKAAVKRLRMTKSGLLKKRNAGRQHILGKKNT